MWHSDLSIAFDKKKGRSLLPVPVWAEQSINYRKIYREDIW